MEPRRSPRQEVTDAGQERQDREKSRQTALQDIASRISNSATPGRTRQASRSKSITAHVVTRVSKPCSSS